MWETELQSGAQLGYDCLRRALSLRSASGRAYHLSARSFPPPARSSPMTSRAKFLAPFGLALFLILTVLAPATFSSPQGRVSDSPPASESVDASARLHALARPAAVFDSLGKSVAAAGDVNGDGLSDYAVGAPGAGGTGQVLIYLGSSTGSFTLQATLTAGDATSGFGAAIAPAGDINGDG